MTSVGILILKASFLYKIVVIVVGPVDMLIKGVRPCRLVARHVNKLSVSNRGVIHKSTGFYFN